MYCPRCGQQQVSDETKFCNRCGFQMGLIPHLLAHGGVLPQLAELSKGKAPLFSRKNGLIFTALWFIFWVMMMPAFFGVAGADEVAGVSAIFGVFSTMMLMIISIAFLKRAPKKSDILPYEIPAVNAHPGLYGSQAVGALPPQQSQPAQVYSPPQAGAWRAPDTGEFSHRPGSVTDSTTKLLQKEEENH
jgi:hypothetical protein